MKNTAIRPVFSTGRIADLVNAGILPESVLEHTSAKNASVEFCAHDRGREDRRDDRRDDRRETR